MVKLVLFKFNAANCALDTGLFASILSTLPNPTIVSCYVPPCKKFEQVFFKFNAANCALDTGLLASLVLSTFC
jgi:hypothetical protein